MEKMIDILKLKEKQGTPQSDEIAQLMKVIQLRELLLEISKGQQAHIECTDRTSPTGLLTKELCK